MSEFLPHTNINTWGMPPDLLLYIPCPHLFLFLDLPLLTYTSIHHGVIQSAEHVSDCPIRDYGLVNPFQLTRPVMPFGITQVFTYYARIYATYAHFSYIVIPL